MLCGWGLYFHRFVRSSRVWLDGCFSEIVTVGAIAMWEQNSFMCHMIGQIVILILIAV